MEWEKELGVEKIKKHCIYKYKIAKELKKKKRKQHTQFWLTDWVEMGMLLEFQESPSSNLILTGREDEAHTAHMYAPASVPPSKQTGVLEW